MFFSISVTHDMGNLVGIALILQIIFGSVDIFTLLILPIQENEVLSPLFSVFCDILF